MVKFPQNEEIFSFRDKILEWHIKNKRDYPWRQTRDPFKLLIAEMMLRRTKADQVIPVYEKFFETYSNINDLSKAKKKELEKILYSLGLRWRTDAFFLVAKAIKKNFNGKVPRVREELKSLPGVGDYVAGAVLSVGFGLKEWIVDSNVVRVFKRFFGIKTSKEGRRDKKVIEMAKIYVDCKKPRDVNLAILDFAALVCYPKKPNCLNCPLRNICQFANQIQNSLQ